MTTWHSFYDVDTGLLNGSRYFGPTENAAANAPPGFGFVIGQIDFLSSKVDVSTGKIIDYQPPQPSDDHEWNVETKRWQLKPDVEARNRQRAAALLQLQQLDAKETRAVSDLLTSPEDETARSRLAAVRAQKDELRKQL